MRGSGPFGEAAFAFWLCIVLMALIVVARTAAGG